MVIYNMSVRALFHLTSLIAFARPSISADITLDTSIGRLETAYNTLQQWYNASNGLWIPSTGWWNSANCKCQKSLVIFMVLFQGIEKECELCYMKCRLGGIHL